MRQEKLAKLYYRRLVRTFGKNVDVLYEKGFDALFPIVSGPQSLEEAMENGELNLTRTAENVLRLIKRTKFSI